MTSLLHACSRCVPPPDPRACLTCNAMHMSGATFSTSPPKACCMRTFQTPHATPPDVISCLQNPLTSPGRKKAKASALPAAASTAARAARSAAVRTAREPEGPSASSPSAAVRHETMRAPASGEASGRESSERAAG